MAKTVSELAREIIARLDRGEPLDQALSIALSSGEIDEETRLDLEAAGLRDAVVHEAFHELLDWHASFGGLAEFVEIDEAIHRTADRIGHDFEGDAPEHEGDTGPRLCEELLEILPANDRLPYDMHRVIECVADDGQVFEVQPGTGSRGPRGTGRAARPVGARRRASARRG